MFNLGRDKASAEDNRQELLSSYLDNALTPVERERFEAQLKQDPRLQSELEQLRALKLQLRSMPHRRVPRSFALDPAAYQKPKSQPLLQLYPVLRGATALTAFFLIFTLALGAFRGQFMPGGGTAMPVAGVMATEQMAEEAAPALAEEAMLSSEQAAATPAPELFESTPAEPEMDAAAESSLAAEAPALESAPSGGEAIGVTEAPAEEARVSPTASIAATQEIATPAGEIAAADTTGQIQPEPADSLAPLLGPIQIGLAIAFLLLLILFFVARRQVNRL